MSLQKIKDTGSYQEPEEAEITGIEKILHISFELQGQTLSASVTCSILSLDESLQRDRALVRLSAPEKYDDLPAMSKLKIYALATCAQALKDPPAWLDEWIGRYDPLLFAIYEEVAAHERDFFQGHLEANASEENERSLISIRSLNVPTST